MKSLKSYFVIILSLNIFIIVAGCTSKNTGTGSLYVPTSADITVNATLTELQQGRDLYINNCGSCHSLYSPDNYSPAQWKVILGSMAPKTSLSSSQILLVTKYVSRGKQ